MANKLNNIQYLIVHHTATARDTTTFEAVKKYHISKGWGNIGYHFFITANGKRWYGRSEQTIGAHAKADNMNFRSLGICLTGNFMNEEPTPAQKYTLLNLITALRVKYQIKANSILGHREITGAKTLCPGDHLLDWIIKYRQEENKATQSPQINEAILRIEEALKILKRL